VVEEQKAAIQALKAEYPPHDDRLRHMPVKWYSRDEVLSAIDRAVSIATQRREASPEDAERAARALHGAASPTDGTGPSWFDSSEAQRLMWRSWAEAALAAMSPAAEVERLRQPLIEARKTIRNAWGAVSSGQTLDKDVEGMLRNALTRVDAVLAVPAPPAGEPTK
jgi:hypothetical protein